jgi:hypothetical protein
MTWYLVNSYTPSGGPIGAVAAGQVLAGGWIDESGNTWQITSGNSLQSATVGSAGALARPISENPTDNNAQISINFNAGSNGNANNTYYMLFRGSNFTGSLTAYYLGFDNNAGGTPAIHFYASASGSLNSINLTQTGTGVITLGTHYIATANVVQTNSTTSTLTLTITNLTGTVITSATATDTTAALQNVTGQAALFNFEQAGDISNVSTYTDYPLNATGYTITLANSGNTNNSYTGTINLSGGNALTSSLVVTVTDSLGSSISPDPITIASGATSTTFTYFPTVVGSHALSFTHTGGNTGMSNPSNITFIATSAFTWYIVSNYTPSGGPVAAKATPGSIGGGWIDNSGNVWNISSSNYLESVVTGVTPWLSDLLLRPSSENATDFNSQLVINFIGGINTQGGSSYYACFRNFTNGTGANSYFVGFSAVGGQTPTIQVYSLIANNITQLAGLTTVGSGTITAGVNYIATINILQTSSTASTITVLITDTNNNNIISGSINDNTTVLQNVTGQIGLFNFNQGGAITGLKTYTDYVASASGYTITISPTSGFVNNTFQGTLTLTGGSTLTSPLSVTISDSLGSTFSSNPIILNTNSGSTLNFSYTPTVAGSHTLSFTYTGGNTGMSNSANVSFAATASGPFINANNTSGCTASPYNWTPSVNSSTGLQTWNPGAYLRFYVSNCAAGVTLIFDTASNGLYCYQIDNGPLNAYTGTSVPGTGQLTIALPDNGNHVIWIRHYSIPQTAGRWNRTLYLGVFGLQLPTGGTIGTAINNPKNILIYGDSITEGILAYNGIDANPYDYSYLVGESLYPQGFEYGVDACGSGGYTVYGAGSVPPALTIGNAGATWWNMKDQTYSQLTNGLFTIQPTIILENWGANDSLQGITGTTLQNVMVALWQDLRAAAPNALIVKIVPIGGFARTDIQTAFSTYQSTAKDLRLILVDLNFDARMNAPSYFYTNTDVNYHLHPGIFGHSNIASQLMSIIQQNYDKTIAVSNRWYHA